MKLHPGLTRSMRWMLLGMLAPGLLGGCSIRKLAVNKLGDALAGGGSTFASDDDPELVRAAVPFSLKLMESLLAESPEHRGLLLAAASGFTQYAYAFVQQDAEELKDRDLAAADALYQRARRLYARAREYGLRGLETRHSGFAAALRRDARAAVARADRRDVPLLFWTAAAWGAAISISKEDPDMIADQLIVEALLDRALQLDETYDHGAIHGLLISYEMVRQGAAGEPAARARAHFDRAEVLAQGRAIGHLVSFAESVCVEKQDRAQFTALLHRALAFDPDTVRETRLSNLIAQRRARWLLARIDDLFLPAP